MINEFTVKESSRNLFAQINYIKNDNDLRKASKDFIEFINSRNVKELLEPTCPEIKEETFAKKKKINIINEFSSANFHDEQDVKNLFNEEV